MYMYPCDTPYKYLAFNTGSKQMVIAVMVVSIDTYLVQIIAI